MYKQLFVAHPGQIVASRIGFEKSYKWSKIDKISNVDWSKFFLGSVIVPIYSVAITPTYWLSENIIVELD